MTQHPKAAESASSPAGRWFLAGLGVMLALIGAVFVWLMWRSYDRARKMHAWPEVECLILAADVSERPEIDPNSPPEFRVEVLYGYHWDGAPYTGDRLTLRGSSWTSKRDVIEQRLAEYPVGLRTTCRVDPENPRLAVLKPDSKAPLYSIWFPGIFVIGGITMAVKAVRGPKKLA